MPRPDLRKIVSRQRQSRNNPRNIHSPAQAKIVIMNAERADRHDIHEYPHVRDGEIAELATRQHGVVSRDQLSALGIGRGAVGHRLASGRLHPVHQGVYAVGHCSLTIRSRWMAAVLGSGDNVVLSHRDAGELWGLVRPSGRRLIEVTGVGERSFAHPGVKLHRANDLHADDRVEHEGIPVTSVARTLLDLAATLNTVRFRQAFETADRLDLLDMRSISPLVTRSCGRRGVRPLRAILDDYCEQDDARSELERRFIRISRKVGLPRPAVNLYVEGCEVDILWRKQRLVAELDSFEFHKTREAFERDRARDVGLQAAGYRVIRLTWRQLNNEATVVNQIKRLLDG